MQQLKKHRFLKTDALVRDNASVNKRVSGKQTRCVFQPRYFSG